GGEVELEFNSRTGSLVVNGGEPYATQASRLIEALLAAPDGDGTRTTVVPVTKSPPDKLRLALTAYQTGAGPADDAATAVRRAPQNDPFGSPLARLFQPEVVEEQMDEEVQFDQNGQPIINEDDQFPGDE